MRARGPRGWESLVPALGEGSRAGEAGMALMPKTGVWALP